MNVSTPSGTGLEAGRAARCAIASGDETALAWGWVFGIGAAGGVVVGERNGGAAALRHRIRRRDSTGVGLGVCDWGSGRRWRHCAIASGDETALAWGWAFVIGAAGGGGASDETALAWGWVFVIGAAGGVVVGERNGGAAALRRRIRRRDSTGVGLGVCDWGSGRRWSWESATAVLRRCAIASGDETALAWAWAFVIGAAGGGVVGERNGGAAALRRRIRRRDSTGVGLGVCDWGSGRRWRHCAVASGDETALAWGWVLGISAAGGGGASERNGGAAAVAPHMPWLPSSPALALDARCPPPASPPRLHHQLRHRIRRRDSTGVGLGV
eukprot:XP_001694413.1 predicted protein [Chlamydomonas reinhardtii]